MNTKCLSSQWNLELGKKSEIEIDLTHVEILDV